MKKNLFLFSATITLVALLNSSMLRAQSDWTLNGNSNVTSTSKLGTTNSNDVKIFTNNSERIRIKTTGLVGIGTTSPTERLHVNSASGANVFRAQVNGSTKFLVHSGGGIAIGSSVSPTIKWFIR
jgi:hypothetical protein